MEPPGLTPEDTSRPRTLVDADGLALRRPMIDDPELNAMRAADAAREAELDLLNDRDRRRLFICVVGSCVAFPLANLLLITGTFAGLWLQLLLAAAHGVFLGLVRPGVMLSAAATLTVGILIHIHVGAQDHFHTLLALILYCTAGAALGTRENDG